MKYHAFLEENQLFVPNSIATEVKALMKAKASNNASDKSSKVGASAHSVTSGGGLRATVVAAKWRKKTFTSSSIEADALASKLKMGLPRSTTTRGRLESDGSTVSVESFDSTSSYRPGRTLHVSNVSKDEEASLIPVAPSHSMLRRP